MNVDEFIEKIISKYGRMAQMTHAIQELSELSIEITKAQLGRKNRTELIGEIADVELMIKQLKYMFNIYDIEIENVMQYKINRTVRRCKLDCQSRLT